MFDSDPYMNPEQIDYFRNKLQTLKTETEKRSLNCSERLKAGSDASEQVEISAFECGKDLDLKVQARNRDMMRQINDALERIRNGSYGYCLETEEPIGFKRLEANPCALYCLDVQMRMELNQRR